jgi:hypothetical protein
MRVYSVVSYDVDVSRSGGPPADVAPLVVDDIDPPESSRHE